MDIRQINYILDYEMDLKMKRTLIQKLDIAEAINYAYIGSQPKPKNKAHKGYRLYKQWRRKLIRHLFPKKRQRTLWDNLSRKKGKHKI